MCTAFVRSVASLQYPLTEAALSSVNFVFIRRSLGRLHSLSMLRVLAVLVMEVGG